MSNSGQNSRTRAVVPGKAILGVAGARRAEHGQLSGSVVPGRAILGDLAVDESAKLAAARAVAETVADTKAQKGPVKKPVVATTPAPGNPAPVKKREPKVAAGFSEEEAVTTLAANPNAWERILGQEVKRPDGVRMAIAKAVLEAGATATRPKMSKAIKGKLEKALKSAMKPEGTVDAPAPVVVDAPTVEGEKAPEGDGSPE